MPRRGLNSRGDFRAVCAANGSKRKDVDMSQAAVSEPPGVVPVVPPEKTPPSDQSAIWRRYRAQAFISTWMCYFGLYFCRKAFYAVKGDLTHELGFDANTLAHIGVVYLVAYAIGEFNAAAIGTRTGARRILLLGMAVSLGCNIVFGFANNAWTFMGFMFLNGLAQATGWSGTVGTMAHWFRQSERGRVMGVWATCYQIGGVAATSFAAFMLGVWGWRWSFWGASLVLSAIWFLFFFLQKNRPEDVGLKPFEDGEAAVSSSSPTNTTANQVEQTDKKKERFSHTLIHNLLLMGSFYFFIKFIRYTLWSWAPYFLQNVYQLPKDQAGYFSTLFDIFGFMGVLTAGFISDRVFGGKRARMAFIMLIGLVSATFLLWQYGTEAIIGFGIAYSLVGFMLYGPDSLLSGAGAIDVGSRKHAIAAAGIINGMGSVGAVVQEVVIGNLYAHNPGNLAPIFITLTLCAACATTLVILLLRRARRGLCNL